MMSLLGLEAIVTAAVVALAFAIPGVAPAQLASAKFSEIEYAFRRLARRRSLAVVTVGLSVLVGRLLLMFVLPIPSPAVHDEFSYLLAGQTFAAGRLAQSAHPMWVHFET